MAEGLLRHDAGERFEVESAGTSPSKHSSDACGMNYETTWANLPAPSRNSVALIKIELWR
jgi:hypothetical protein